MDYGPEYFEVRRKAWLTPKDDRSDSTPQPLSPGGSSSRQRIAELLSKPGAVESEVSCPSIFLCLLSYEQDIWNRGLQTLWRGLVTGSRFKRPLPLDVVVSSYDSIASLVYNFQISLDQNTLCWMDSRWNLASWHRYPWFSCKRHATPPKSELPFTCQPPHPTKWNPTWSCAQTPRWSNPECSRCWRGGRRSWWGWTVASSRLMHPRLFLRCFRWLYLSTFPRLKVFYGCNIKYM